MIGDEVSSTATSPSTTSQNTQAILFDIFGGDAADPAPAAQPAQSSQRSVDDIMGLFGSSGAVASPVAAAPAPSLFSVPPQTLPQAQAQPPVPVSRPAAPGYTAYDSNELKVVLTPQVSAAKPGVVNIMARFQVTGVQPVSNVNFQAAVPRVRRIRNHKLSCIMSTSDLSDATTTNAPDVESNDCTRCG